VMRETWVGQTSDLGIRLFLHDHVASTLVLSLAGGLLDRDVACMRREKSKRLAALFDVLVLKVKLIAISNARTKRGEFQSKISFTYIIKVSFHMN
jgi:hypothetical protein